tara:strand:+ start:320 stop:1117 length:798 start_codon:yes stop_codon:yes gene_type:complete
MIGIQRELLSSIEIMNLREDVEKALADLPKKNKIVVVTGDSWSAGEWDESKEDSFQWRSEHSIGGYLEYYKDFTIISLPNPGWDDLESCVVVKQFYDLADYIIFFKTCGLRSFQLEDHPTRPNKYGFSQENFKEYDLFSQGLIANEFTYDLLEVWQSKLILIGGLVKIGGKGLALKTIFTLPSVAEFFDSSYVDTQVFGWESMWEYYKDFVKGDKAKRDSLLKLMDIFANKKKYMRSRPDLYWPDGKHPNATAHKKLAEYIAGKI